MSNSIAEVFGKLVNTFCSGVCLRMGVMSLENKLRLHYMPPMESWQVSAWIKKRILYYWKLCDGQLAMNPSGKRRVNKTMTVLPRGNISAKSVSSKALARRFIRQKRMFTMCKTSIK